MSLLREIFQSLDEATLAYLEAAVADAEDVADLLEPFFQDLDVVQSERARLCSALAPTAPPEAKACLVSTCLKEPTGPLRRCLGEPAEAAPAAPSSQREQGRQPELVKEVELEPLWVDGRVEHVHDQADLPAWAKCLFRGAWRSELEAWAPRWSCSQVATLARGTGQAAEKLALAIETSGLDSALCLAGGAELLYERLVGLRRGDLDAAKHACRHLVLRLAEANEGADHYRDLLCLPEDLAMLSSFRGTVVEPKLRRALRPAQPLYSALEPKGLGVKAADAELQQLWGLECGEEEFRVVALLEPTGVRSNLIYVWEAGWWLLASVDFCQHGSAAPGHWHLNRTPAGDSVEHWGPRGSVYHGSCWVCPLWWLVIPEGLAYLQRPDRLDLLPPDLFGDAAIGRSASRPVGVGR